MRHVLVVSRWSCWRLGFIGQIGVSHIDDGGVAYWMSVLYCNDQSAYFSRHTSSQQTRLRM